ncbi:MAG: phytanoyl-CoA dioxygenase family protein, partial [Blastocatellia bacterium]
MSANSFTQTLEQLGVSESSLSAADRRAMDEQGWFVLPNVIGPALLRQLLAAFEKAAGNDNGAPPGGRKETGTRHPARLLDHDPAYAIVCEHPGVIAAIYHALGRPFRLSQFSGRDPLPGFGQQELQADWTPRPQTKPFHVVTTLWMLDDFTADNGATRVVPGTHTMTSQPPKAMADPAAHHPAEKFVTGKAGSVLIFNGHLWHSGTRNNSQR